MRGRVAARRSGSTSAVESPEDRAVVESAVRTATYTADHGLLDAGAAARQLRLAVHGVLYLHGGWASLVDGLADVVRAAGGQIRTRAAVGAVEHDTRVRVRPPRRRHDDRRRCRHRRRQRPASRPGPAGRSRRGRRRAGHGGRRPGAHGPPRPGAAPAPRTAPRQRARHRRADLPDGAERRRPRRATRRRVDQRRALPPSGRGGRRSSSEHRALPRRRPAGLAGPRRRCPLRAALDGVR